MGNNDFNINTKASLLWFALIANTNAVGLLEVADYGGPSACPASSSGCCPADTLNSLKTMNYYPASKYNMVFGSHPLQEIGSGNKQFTAIDGEVSMCWPGNPKDTIKPYGNGAYFYNEWYVDDISGYEEYYRQKFVPVPDELKKDPQQKWKEIPEELRQDIAILKSPLKDTKTCMPADVCKHNLQALRNHYDRMMKESSNMKAHGELVGQYPPSRRKGKMLKNEGKYVQELFTRIYELLDIVPANSSNPYIEKHIDNIFPTTVKVAEATPDEVNIGKCAKGGLRKYVDKNRKRHALCVGDNVDGECIADYLTSRPETKNWTQDTFVENLKYWFGKFKDKTSRFFR